jgi:hypothetical protein
VKEESWAMYLITMEKSFEFLDKHNQEMREACEEEGESEWKDEEWIDIYSYVFRDKWYNKMYVMYT